MGYPLLWICFIYDWAPQGKTTYSFQQQIQMWTFDLKLIADVQGTGNQNAGKGGRPCNCKGFMWPLI